MLMLFKLSSWDISWYLVWCMVYFEIVKIKIFLSGLTILYTNMLAGVNFLIFGVVLNYITG